MNPNINTSVQTNVHTGSSAPATSPSSNRATANQPAPEGLGNAPSLLSYEQSSVNKKADPEARFTEQELTELVEKRERTIAKNILNKLAENRRVSLEEWELTSIIRTLFFSKAESSTACFMHQMYTNKELHELIPLFERVTYRLSASIINPTSNILPPLPEGSKLDLNAILDTLCEHLETVEDITQRSTKITEYLQLYFLLSGYYEAPVLDKAFAEYSKTRIAKLEKLMGYRGPLYVKDCALINQLCIRSAASLLKLCKESPSHVLKIKQDFACWLMTSFSVDEGKSHLLILDFMKDVFQKSKLKTSFHEQGIDFDKEFLNDPIFVSCILRVDSTPPKNLDTLTFLEPSISRVSLLEKLERLGLKPENINTHHPILELALELKDPELLRHLILEYKFNPYYISDTTGYSVWQLLTQQKHNYSDKFQHEAANICEVYDTNYYGIESKSNVTNRHIEAVALNKKTPHNSDINRQNTWGETALIHAAKFGYDAKHLFAVQELDLTVKDHTGKTALDYAKENNNKALVKLLEEHKRALTTVRLIDTLGENGAKDNYQRLIAFLHRKGTDGLSLIERAYQSQNTRIIEVIESYLFAISVSFGDYIRTAEGKGAQPLHVNTILPSLRARFSENPSTAKCIVYIMYYYYMYVYAGLSDGDLNESIHGMIALISDANDVEKLNYTIPSAVMSLYTKAFMDAQNCQDLARLDSLLDIKRKAYKTMAHWLVFPVYIQNQSQNSCMISFLDEDCLKFIDSIDPINKTNLNLKDHFFNNTDFIKDVLSFCTQNLSGYRANAVSIFQKLKKLGLNHNYLKKNAAAILRVAIEAQETSLCKYLILDEGLSPFACNQGGWSFASYCRHPDLLPIKILNTEVARAFADLWEEEIEPALMKEYRDLPPHSPKTPRIDLIAQGYIAATPENINLKNQWGETPLIFAAKYGYDVAKLLTIAGIDIKIKDKFKKTALSYAELNKDERSERVINDYREHQNKINQVFTAVHRLYQKKEANLTNQPVKKLSKRKIKKAEKKRLKQEAEEAKNAAKNNETAPTPIAQSSTQTATLPPITITIPERLEQEQNNNLSYPPKDKMAKGNKANPSAASFDNFVYREPTKEPSHLKIAQDKITQENKRKETKKNKSLFSRIGTKVKTVVDILKNPDEAKETIAQNALQLLASKRLKAQEKPLIGYPDLLELLDLIQDQDPKLKPTSGVKKTLKALDAALDPKSKNVGAKLTVKELEAALSWAQSGDSMALTQRGSHTNLHFEGGGLTLPGAQDDYVKFIYIKNSAHTIRTALLERLGIKSYDVSEPALNASPTDSPPAESTPAETKNESSEEEGLYES